MFRWTKWTSPNLSLLSKLKMPTTSKYLSGRKGEIEVKKRLKGLNYSRAAKKHNFWTTAAEVTVCGSINLWSLFKMSRYCYYYYYYFRVARICYFVDAVTVSLLLAKKWISVDTYKLNLYHFYCNARQNCKVVCVKLIRLRKKAWKISFIFGLPSFVSKLQNSRLILWNFLKKLKRHQNSRQNLGLESSIWIIQNHSRSAWYHIKSCKTFLLFN